MSPRPTGRTQACSAADAATRLRQAHKFIEVAQRNASKDDEMDYANQTTALAVLAGIAASDAACCKALGKRSRGQDHRAAIALVEQVKPGGKQAATSLNRLLSFKDEAQYGFYEIGGQKVKSALRLASDLIGFAERTLQR